MKFATERPATHLTMTQSQSSSLSTAHCLTPHSLRRLRSRAKRPPGVASAAAPTRHSSPPTAGFSSSWRTSSNTGAALNPVGRRRKAVNRSCVGVRRQWMSVHKMD